MACVPDDEQLTDVSKDEYLSSDEEELDLVVACNVDEVDACNFGNFFGKIRVVRFIALNVTSASL